MNTITDETIDTLNHLIHICEDTAAAFEEVADDIEYLELSQLFRSLCQQRRTFVEELSACVRQLGGEPDVSGTVTGKLQRGWIKLREALTSKVAHAVLQECERGEDRLVAAYREALAKLVDPGACEVVRRQSNGVKIGHDTIRDLRDSPVYAKR